MAEEETTEETTEEAEETSGPDEDEGWNRLQDTVKQTVSEAMEEWQSKQKQVKKTSSPSQRKQAAPKRKQGFLTTGFFSGLTETRSED
jgi:hypothetical protein